MRTYVRARVKGGTYFFTVNLAQRHNNTLLVDHIELLTQAFRQTRLERPFTMSGFVILPEHCIAYGPCLQTTMTSLRAGD